MLKYTLKITCLITLILLFSVNILSAEKGTLKAKVELSDGTTPDANVFIINNVISQDTIKVELDNSGILEIELDESFYNVVFSKKRYEQVVVEEVKILGTKDLGLITLQRNALNGVLDEDFTLDRDYKILEEDELIIKEGVTLDLNNFNFTVNGSLLIKSTKEKPVLLKADSVSKIFHNYIDDETYVLNLSYLIFENIELHKDIEKTEVENYNITFSEVEFRGNTHLNLYPSQININDCIFKNITSFKGILFTARSKVNFSNSVVKNCNTFSTNSKSMNFQGLITSFFDVDLNLINSIFCNNVASNISIGKAENINITNCLFENNINKYPLKDDPNKKHNHINSVFEGNINIYNSIFNNNNSKILNHKREQYYSTEMSNNVFWNNGDIKVDSSLKYFAEMFKVNQNGDSVDVYGNLFKAPEVNCDNQDIVSISEGSVCIDAGVDNPYIIESDIYNNERVHNNNGLEKSYIDIGPVEYGAGEITNIETKQSQPISIHPNPADDRILINLNSIESNIDKIQLTDILGSSYTPEYNLNSREIIVNVADLDTGVYFITLYSNGKVVMQEKLLKE